MEDVTVPTAAVGEALSVILIVLLEMGATMPPPTVVTVFKRPPPAEDKATGVPLTAAVTPVIAYWRQARRSFR
jgi:hypothetical protein